MIGLFAKLLKVLNSEDSPTSIAWAITLAFWFSLLPIFSIAKWLILVVIALFRIQLSAFLLFCAIFPLLAWVMDPWLNSAGIWLLSNPSFEAIWTQLLSNDVAQTLALNNSLGISSLLFGLVSLWPLLILSRRAIGYYREKLKSRILQWKVVQFIKASKVYQSYQSLN